MQATDVLTAWREYAIAVEMGDREGIDLRWRAFEQAVTQAVPLNGPLTVTYQGTSATIQSLTAPLLDDHVRHNLAELREAFCITLTLSDQELPYAWDDMERAFADWLQAECKRIAATVPDKIKVEWEASREDEEDEEDEEEYDWSDYSDDHASDDEEEETEDNDK